MLDPQLQNGQKLPKWQPRLQVAQYVGASPLHASTLGLVRNLKTGNISPQFHVVYDSFFTTVHCTEDQVPELWPDLVTFSSFCTPIKYDDSLGTPKLADEWVEGEELKERNRMCKQQKDVKRQMERKSQTVVQTTEPRAGVRTVVEDVQDER